jgi:hypothetical protein
MRIYALVLLLMATSTGAQEHRQTRAAIFKTNAHSCADFSMEAYGAIRSMPFPDDWTIVVTCNDHDWQNWLAKSKYPRTNTAFTGLKQRITVLNGFIFAPSYRRTSPRYVPKFTMAHEIGHIRCQCEDEFTADKLAVEILNETVWINEGFQKLDRGAT